MEVQQTEPSTGSRLGATEKDIAILNERIASISGTVCTNESRVDKLRQFMWKAVGIIGIASSIPVILAIYDAVAK